ncbi:MAG: hypothetical protein RL660_2040 [Bacteroidota bacterium]|jgi:hypothetical protein
MKKSIINAAVLLLITLCGSLTAAAQTVSPDAKLKKQLDKMKIKYEVNEKTGNFKIIFKMDNDRTQQVIVKSKPSTYEGVEYREIYSVAAGKPSLTDYSQETLMSLMNMNYNNTVGYWQIDGANGAPYTLEFAVRISPDAENDQLNSLIELCAKQAEKMELKLTTEDKY